MLLQTRKPLLLLSLVILSGCEWSAAAPGTPSSSSTSGVQTSSVPDADSSLGSNITGDSRCDSELQLFGPDVQCPGEPKKFNFDKTSKRCLSNAATCLEGLKFSSFEECNTTCHSRNLQMKEYTELEKCSEEEMRVLDEVLVSNPRVDGDDLILDVNYGGGCLPFHKFRLCYSGNVLEGGPLPSLSAKLIHDAYGDNCEASLDSTLRFSLRNLKALGHKRVIIRLDESLSVEYPTE